MVMVVVGVSFSATLDERAYRVIMWLEPYADSREHYVLNVVTLAIENKGVERPGSLQSVLENSECLDIRQYVGRGSGETNLSGVRCSWEKVSGLVALGNNRIRHENKNGSVDITLLLETGEKGFDLDLVYRRRGGLGTKNLEIQTNSSLRLVEVVSLGGLYSASGKSSSR